MNKKIKWIFKSAKVLIVASAVSLVARYLFTESTYMATSAFFGLESNRFKTYMIISAILSGVVVAAMCLLAIFILGNALDSRSSWTILFSGVAIIVTTPSHGLMIAPSAVLGLLLIVVGFYFLFNHFSTLHKK